MAHKSYIISKKTLSSKKSQNALEFMVIMIFIFVILSMFLGVIGKRIADIHQKDQEKLAKDFASQINNELKILNKAEPGYERKLLIYTQDYDIDILYSLNNYPVFIKLVDVVSGTNRTYYFDLIGNYNLDTGNLIINKTVQYSTEFNHNVTILTFKKLYKRDVNVLDIS